MTGGDHRRVPGRMAAAGTSGATRTSAAPARHQGGGSRRSRKPGQGRAACARPAPKLDQQVPASLDVHLICDNYSTHTAPVITRWLQAHPRFHMHFTPTYSSWLNQVERWFGLLTDQRLRRGAHTSLQSLEQDIRDCIRTLNEYLRPSS